MNYGWVVALAILMGSVIDGLWLWHRTGLSKKRMASTSSLGCLWLAILLAIAGICLDFTTTYLGTTVFGINEGSWMVAQYISWGWWPWLAVDMVWFSMWILGGIFLIKKIQNKDLQGWMFMPAIFSAWVKLAIGGANFILLMQVF